VNLPVMVKLLEIVSKEVLVMRVVGELGAEDIKLMYAPPVVT